ncbi:MAG TPA: hypothetical protein PKL69_10420 [Agitococcus sp.]|nr:hypothetical protein [Agitococcus sp.]HNI64056.1 hypothetical protein [Agitococcus sp.]HNJ86596.1 hypothetical protein [Agitococcus sp.]HNL80737.1 hypothetical protein [Agitococcus sp.]HNN28757.1 hypothetical protein [Agitococcus sp.]
MLTVLRYLILGLLISIVAHIVLYDFANFKQAYDWLVIAQDFLFIALLLAIYTLALYQDGQYEWRGVTITRQQYPKAFWFNVLILSSISVAFFVATIFCVFMFFTS